MEYVLSAERDLAAAIRGRFPSATVLPVMGNHDSSPPSFFPQNHTFYSYFLERSGWQDLIEDPAARGEFSCGCGFYSHVLNEGLVAVLLNTNLYYGTNNTGPDPCGQITWLEETLKGREENVNCPKFNRSSNQKLQLQIRSYAEWNQGHRFGARASRLLRARSLLRRVHDQRLRRPPLQ